MTATFTVQGSTWVNLNGSHGNAYARQSRMDDWLHRATLAIRAAGCQPVTEPVEITAIVRRTTNAKADAHNVTPTIKACIDAAVRAELISDDNDTVVRWLHIGAGSKASHPTIEIRIEAV